ASSFDSSLTIGGLATFNDQVVLTGGDLTLNGGALTVGATSTLIGAVTTGGNMTIGGRLLSFTDFTFTADSTTDQLTKTAHGLETGDGPVRTSNSGGALPGGLTAGTDYWVIKIDANNFKLAISSDANAFAGIAIDITGNGTGTQTLNHQPTRKRRTDATVTRNLTVNGTATANVAFRTAGSAGYTFGTPRPLIYPGSAFVINSGSPTRAGDVWTFSTSVAAELICPIWFGAGTVLSSLVWSFNRNSNNISGEFDFKLVKRSFGDGGSTTANVYSDVVSTGTGFTTRDTVSAFAPYTFEAGFIYHLSIATSALTFSGAPSFDGVKLVVDRV